MKKVLFLYDAMHLPGGAQCFISILSTELARRGHDLTLLTKSKHQPFAYPFHGLVSRARRTSFDRCTYNRLYERNVARAMRAADVIIDHRAKASGDLFARIAKKHHFDARTLQVIHTGKIETYIGSDVARSRNLFGGCWRVVCLTADMQRSVVDRYGLINTCVIPTAIDTKRIDALLAADPPHDLPERSILACGRLIHTKGFDMLLRAYHGSDPARDNIRLVILGDGPQQQSLVTLARQLDLSGKVLFPGFVTNPFVYTLTADFFVLSSRHEGLPLVLLENLHCRLPAIGFNCLTGPGDIIRHEVNGLFVEPFDQVELSRFDVNHMVRDEDIFHLRQAINRLHNDASLHAALKQQARPSVESYRIENIADLYEQWFDFSS
jgi:N-acetylgalactosamine-N,N'-diacetylbacillosaminyl-diphospho-undecaprenol 4-alpha-N-acetylgalactosaminyltransferase